MCEWANRCRVPGLARDAERLSGEGRLSLAHMSMVPAIFTQDSPHGPLIIKVHRTSVKFGPVNQSRSMSQIINSFNFRWGQSGEQNHESGQDLSFNFAFSCKTSFVTQYLTTKPNSSPTFPQSILIQNPSQSTINVRISLLSIFT